MAQQLPLFRAARLVGVSRYTLQKEIRKKGIETFEGMITVPDLLTLYPEADLSHDTEFDRIQNIKATAFSKRVREKLLPDSEILASRLTEVGQKFARTRSQLVMHKSVVKQIIDRLESIEAIAGQEKANDEVKKEIRTLIDQISITLNETLNAADPSNGLMAYDTVLRVMSAHIKIQPSNHEFWLEGNSTLLDAGIRSGLSLNYGCTNGNCGLCKARVVSGEVKKICNHDYVLSESEKTMNYILMCSNTAVSDVVLEALEAKGENDIPQQEITAKVKKINPLNDSVTELHLQTPRIQRLRFLAGQSVNLSFPNGESIDTSIASCPCDDRNILFHLRPKGSSALNHTLNTLSKSNEIKITGPHGHFLLNEESNRDQIFIAFDTGFAPIKSLIEHAMALDKSTHMYLYWVGNNKEDLYLHNLCRSWADALENFHYFPVTNNDPLKTIMEHNPANKAGKYDLYLAGNEDQLMKTKEKLLNEGFSNEQLMINIIS